MRSSVLLLLVAAFLAAPVRTDAAPPYSTAALLLARNAAVASEPSATFSLYPRHRTYAISGSVQAVLPHRSLIRMRDDMGFDAAVLIPSNARVMRHGRVVSIGAIRPGDHIRGWAKRPADKFVALSLEIH